MAQFLKQSTAFTFRIGPFVDSTDGVTAETGLTIGQADIQISKAGGAFAQTSASPTTTHDADGWYQCPLTTTDTGTLGTLTVQVVMAGALPVWKDFMVLPANVYDSLVAGSDVLNADVTYWNGSVLTGKTGAIKELGILESGTMQTGSAAGTAVLRSATSFADDLVIGSMIVIDGGTGVGQSRIIYDWVSTTDTASISPNWTTTPDNTSTYMVVAAPPAPTNSATLPAVNLTSWNGTAVATPDTAGYPKVTIKDGTGAGEIALTSGAIDTVTNLTNAPTAGDFTATMKTSIGTAVAASAVASVTGNVGGNVTGSVGSVATGGITAASIATGAIDADAVAADAVAEIQSGLATAASMNATRYTKNTASQKVYFTLVDSTDHVTRKTGITVTAQRSLDGAAFGSATGTVTEVGSGVYYLSTSTADINADDVVFRFTGTACDPVELHVVTY